MEKLPDTIKPTNRGEHIIQSPLMKMDDLCMDAIKFSDTDFLNIYALHMLYNRCALLLI